MPTPEEMQQAIFDANNDSFGTSQVIKKERLPDPEYRPMTIAELVKELEMFAQNLNVMTEGCDCVGPGVSVDFYGDDAVLIKRSM